MPGPVSDSRDSEFGTGANADDVRCAMEDVIRKITTALEVMEYTTELVQIVFVAQHEQYDDLSTPVKLSERDMRMIRFGLLRALESI